MSASAPGSSGARHAVVIGGSIGGCIAAQVLSSAFERVTLIEKDNFEDEVVDRRSVPQEKHVHLLLLRGKQLMEEFFPGLLADLTQAGAESADQGHDVKCFQQGSWRYRFRTGIDAHYCSRGLLDNLVRHRIRRNERITVVSNTRVQGLQIRRHEGLPQVHGVLLDGAAPVKELAADLVVDVSGRGSRMSEWLAKAELGEVRKVLVETRLGYASRIYRRRPEFANRWKVMLVLPTSPRNRSMGVISPIEGDRWLVTTGGWFGEFPKSDPNEFLNFLGKLPAPDIHEVIREAEPLSDVACFGIPGSQRRYYEELPVWPQGLLVMGDALCSLNPLYSQGMTICALEADVLKQRVSDWLQGRVTTGVIQSMMAKAMEPAWNVAVAEDMRFPETQGQRSLGLKFQHWYGAGVSALANSHRLTLQTQVGVINLVVPPKELFRPEIAVRVVLNSLRPRFGDRSKPHA
ncbi:NAD(P)/FAD-dependent oxidoreductase [Vitiosangium sp. GDMCC 1.1324]|uniref:NAD(P)/FAD-dependent oxidoreductase n=1 Tax=Vitiosangium sp. (strain GDMCC 1.1324) TaxID=2138576 RepID=UPI000D3C3112|nr:FAD-dependent oxidoreductase [Vitiosangium sp. GDMCC 1.1324]PTL84523.1 FAD-dependent oxidoreductase [Vitiosangium sp. GDMCC 1.1324]